MDLSYSEAEQQFRAHARDWLSANVPHGLASSDSREGFSQHVEWEKRLFDARWAVVSWPQAYGGRDATLWEWLIFEEEYYRAGGPARVTQNGIFLLAPTLFEFGTQEQKDTVLPRMAAAQDLWCQGWSEPGAGSDLASISSRAVRDGDGWRLTGQKIWTTRGAFCTHIFGLFRSDPESERHRGLTYFMIPLDSPGVRVRGFNRLDGDEGFAEVFFDDVHVPPEGVLGEVNQGWKIAMATTGSERGLTLRSPGRFTASAERLIELAKERPLSMTPLLRDRITQAWIEAEAYQLYTLQQVTGIASGDGPGAASSMNKIFWSELDVKLQRTALDLLGDEAELDATWSRSFIFSLGGPIYAGTNEIQRNIVADRVLGLPRSR